MGAGAFAALRGRWTLSGVVVAGLMPLLKKLMMKTKKLKKRSTSEPSQPNTLHSSIVISANVHHTKITAFVSHNDTRNASS